MKTFPMFLQMKDRCVVIAGGGEQAAQKCRLILKTDARVRVLSDQIDPELLGLSESGQIEWDRSAITSKSFEKTALVFIATGCPGADASLHMLAKTAGATVNVVDQPELCDALTPSIVDRSPVVVAIGTEGSAPVLARQIKTRIEESLEPRLGDLAALAGRLRGQAAARLQPRKRRDLWRWVFNGPVRKAHAMGQERQAAKLIKEAIETGNFGGAESGALTVLDAAHGSKDLMTLRSVQRLQEADALYFDGSVAPEVLDLARRDAERIPLVSSPSSELNSVKQISGLLTASAKQGRRTVFISGAGLAAILPDIVATVTCDVCDVEIVPSIEMKQDLRDDLSLRRSA